MRRTERLFAIIQILRRSRRPVTGQQLAQELEVSLRTLYRDMAELLAQRIPIRGEAGTGYLIDSEFDMPPLMLTPDELEAAVLGAAWVAQQGDAALSRGARDLVSKLTAVLPLHLRPVVLDAALHPVSFRAQEEERVNLGDVRRAIRDQRKVVVHYRDADQRTSQRTIWPFLIGYMEAKRVVVAHCELRNSFRHFRADRMLHLSVLDQQFPERTASLRKRWDAAREASQPPAASADAVRSPRDNPREQRDG